jgi:hypothetical protein
VKSGQADKNWVLILQLSNFQCRMTGEFRLNQLLVVPGKAGPTKLLNEDINLGVK